MNDQPTLPMETDIFAQHDRVLVAGGLIVLILGVVVEITMLAQAPFLGFQEIRWVDFWLFVMLAQLFWLTASPPHVDWTQTTRISFLLSASLQLMTILFVCLMPLSSIGQALRIFLGWLVLVFLLSQLRMLSVITKNFSSHKFVRHIMVLLSLGFLPIACFGILASIAGVIQPQFRLASWTIIVLMEGIKGLSFLLISILAGWILIGIKPHHTTDCVMSDKHKN